MLKQEVCNYNRAVYSTACSYRPPFEASQCIHSEKVLLEGTISKKKSRNQGLEKYSMRI